MQNILVIAETRGLGACLEWVLREHGYHVVIVGSYDVLKDLPSIQFDLVIVTNTSLPAAHIQSIVPDIKGRNPDTCVIVLSGYCPDDFVADLKQKGMDGFLPLPYEEDALLKEVAGLLSATTP